MSRGASGSGPADASVAMDWSPRRPSPLVAVLVLGIPAGVLAGLGLGGVAVVAVPLALGCALGLLGEVPLFLFIVTAVSGVGFHWADAGVSVAGQDINLSGLHWGLILATSGALLLRRFPRPLPRPLALYAGYLAVALLTLLWTPALFEGAKQWLMFLLPALVAGVVLAHVRREDEVALILAGYWLALVVAVVVAVAMPLTGTQGGLPGFAGALGARTLAIFLLPLMALALGSARYRSPAYLWAVAAIAVVGLATLSRTAVGVMLVLPLLAMHGMRWPPRLAVLGLAVILGLGALQIEAFRERFGRGQVRVTAPTVTGEGTAATLAVGGLNLSGRGWIWLQVGRHALQRPVLGHGTGSASAYVSGLPRSPVAHPHNEYLRVLHDQGAVGLLVILAFGGATALYFRRLHRTASTARVRQLALASYLATAAYAMIAVTDNPLVYTTFFTQNVFVLYALALARERFDSARAGAVGA